jgi:hypothetical protein
VGGAADADVSGTLAVSVIEDSVSSNGASESGTERADALDMLALRAFTLAPGLSVPGYVGVGVALVANVGSELRSASNGASESGTEGANALGMLALRALIVVSGPCVPGYMGADVTLLAYSGSELRSASDPRERNLRSGIIYEV